MAKTVIEKGFLDDYRYIVTEDRAGKRAVFLDCGRKLEAFKKFLQSSIIMSFWGLAIIFIVVFVMAGRILRPVAESHLKQRQFITDAGHEMKTPLTIISANIDLLQMEIGDNECLNDIAIQTKRLRGLTDDLTVLSRMEEIDKKMTKIEFPISEIATETAESFIHPAEKKNIDFAVNVERMLSYNGNEKSIIQLLNIVLDNALKYTPDKGKIDFSLSKQNKNIVISVANTTDFELDKTKFQMVFERFYRTDESRNSKIGGHGVGLSVAQAIVKAHNGKIVAASPTDNVFKITITL